MKQKQSNTARRSSATWPGLLLGSLLILFVVAFLYVAYLFLMWGQTAAAAMPDLPELSLPKLVRQAPVQNDPSSGASGAAWQPSQPLERVEPEPTGRVTILLMGVDNRPNEPVARTDTIMIVTLNLETGETGILSLPRDLWVRVPALDREAKINTVHVLGEINKFPGGGPALLSDTITELIGYPIDYYVRVDFEGFRQIVDLIGGIEVDVPKEINDPSFPDDDYGYDPLYIPAGRQHMDGATALKYARTRHVDSDYGRADRQQQVILAIKDRIMEPGHLAALLPRLPGLALALANTVQTDVPVDKALSLARSLGDMDLDNPVQIVVDGKMGTETTDPEHGFILIPEMTALRAAAATVFSDGERGASPDEVTRQALKAEGARIMVLNGSTEEGLAERSAAALTAEGLNVVTVGNADRGDYQASWLLTHGNGALATREMLAQRFGISAEHIRAQQVPGSDADLTLVLGADQLKASTVQP